MQGERKALSKAFAAARAANRSLLGAYFTVGFPTFRDSMDVYQALADHCDFVEVGVPCPEPTLDGPPITEAMARSLRHGLKMSDVFVAVREVASATPAVAMSYWSPIERYGPERFAAELAAAGGAGAIVPDVPAARESLWRGVLRANGLGLVPVLRSHDIRETELAHACAEAGEFVYVAATAGPSGSQGPLSVTLPDFVARTRRHTDLPVCVGIGVSNVAQAAAAAACADGVIVGSAFTRLLLAEPHTSGVRAAGRLASELAAAMYR